MFTIRKQFKFEGAHILTNSYSTDCTDFVHGHSYIVEVFIQSETLDDTGMVVDFKLLTDCIDRIVTQWDHRLVMSVEDERIGGVLPVTRVPFNPTAENMARQFYKEIASKLERERVTKIGGVQLSKVRVHETATGYAEYRPTKPCRCASSEP